MIFAVFCQFFGPIFNASFSVICLCRKLFNTIFETCEEVGPKGEGVEGPPMPTRGARRKDLQGPEILVLIGRPYRNIKVGNRNTFLDVRNYSSWSNPPGHLHFQTLCDTEAKWPSISKAMVSLVSSLCRNVYFRSSFFSDILITEQDTRAARFSRI